MNSLYNRLFFRSNILNKNILFTKGIIIKQNHIAVKKRCFFFKTEKNDIIKNEIDEILKNGNATYIDGDDKESLNIKDIPYENKKHKEKNKKKYINNKGKFKRLIIFIGFQSIPIFGLMYLFKYLEDAKFSELNYSFNSSEDIVNEATKLINGSAKCFCLYVDNNKIHTLFIDPSSFENSEVNYEKTVGNVLENEKDCPDIENKNNIVPIEEKDNITSSLYSLNKSLMQKVLNLKSSNDIPLNYVYFGISKNSDIHNFLKNKKNDITLFYSDDKKNVYATLHGNASIIDNEEIKNTVWNNRWLYIISDARDNYILIKFTPSTISLKAIGLKEEHWKNHVVKRSLVNDVITWVQV